VSSASRSSARQATARPYFGVYFASKVASAASAVSLSGASQISRRSWRALACSDFGSSFRTLAALWTQQRWCRVAGNTSSSAFQKPSAPSPTASSGAIARPRALGPTSSSRQLWALSRAPTWKPTSSFLPSGVAPMITSTHSAWGSVRACG
jgi:hypothetical protein